jgi:hypothetical protein
MNNQDKENGQECFWNLVPESALVEPFVKLNVQELCFRNFLAFNYL